MRSTGEIDILCRERTSRLEYVTGFISSVTGLRFRILLTPEDSKYLINYGPSPLVSAFNIPEAGFLSERGIRPFEPEIQKDNGFYLFPSTGFDLPFDIFSAIFYLISRYEEYLSFDPDRYGRFEANQSFSYRQNFLQQPVVDQWLQIFKNKLTSKFPGLICDQPVFTFVSTIDIDSPWAFRFRKAGGNLSGILRNILSWDISAAGHRLKVLAGKEKDPFDVYSFISETEKRYGFTSTFFFLLAHNGKFDLNHSIHSAEFGRLVKDVTRNRPVGIHPSFSSSSRQKELSEEIEKYISLTGEKPVRSRQHFLILRFPDTYRQLISKGISDDFTLGYATIPSFRAGTTYSFRFYDLEREQQTNLIIHPFTVMDVTLRKYMGLSPEQATSYVSDLIAKIKVVNGVFTSLWHNESLSEYGVWKGWRNVFTEMVREASGSKSPGPENKT